MVRFLFSHKHSLLQSCSVVCVWKSFANKFCQLNAIETIYSIAKKYGQCISGLDGFNWNYSEHLNLLMINFSGSFRMDRHIIISILFSNTLYQLPCIKISNIRSFRTWFSFNFQTGEMEVKNPLYQDDPTPAQTPQIKQGNKE